MAPIFKKTRIAPTPSGYLHLGNVFSFALTAALAEKYNAQILLRIDDMDRERTNKLYVQDIFDTLNFLEIPWHEGPKDMETYEHEYSQVHRETLYSHALGQLRDEGHLFACTCSRASVLRQNADMAYPGTCRNSHISLDAANVSWRINTENAGELELKSLDGSKTSARLPAILHDFIVRKKDGLPAYQLTSVIDDLHFGIDLVVRGEDLVPSSLAQHFLASALGQPSFNEITFYHHPLIMGPAGDKLSKSAGDTSVHYLRKDHKTPADIFAMTAAMLGLKGNPTSWQELIALTNLAI